MFRKLIPTLTAEESATLKKYMSAKKAATGSLLVEAGSTEQDVYFLISGQYEVYRKITVAQKPMALKMASLSGPVVMGEMNLFMNDIRNASVVISQEAHYFLLTHEQYIQLKQDHPSIAVQILETVGGEMAKRFQNSQVTVIQNMIEKAATTEAALINCKRFIGDILVCTPDLAKKLFNMDDQPEVDVQMIDLTSPLENEAVKWVKDRPNQLTGKSIELDLGENESTE